MPVEAIKIVSSFTTGRTYNGNQVIQYDATVTENESCHLILSATFSDPSRGIDGEILDQPLFGPCNKRGIEDEILYQYDTGNYQLTDITAF